MTRGEQVKQASMKIFPLPILYNEEQQNNKEYIETWQIAKNNQFGFVRGALWADEHPDLYSVTRKAVEREKEFMINKFCEFMQSCEGYVVSGEKCNYDNFMKFLEEEQ